MSVSVDANLLLYASDSSSPVQVAARSFLGALLQGAEVVCVAWPTLMAYLRISTHPAIFPRALAPEEAWRNVELLLAQPRVRPVGEEDGFWEVYRRATAGLVVRGKLVSDAHLAAILLQHGVRRLYTRDSDFRRFRFLDVRDPFSEP